MKFLFALLAALLLLISIACNEETKTNSTKGKTTKTTM